MSVPLSNLTDTWNNGATVFNAILMNVTNTASNSGSKLIDLQVSSTSVFNVDAFGTWQTQTTTVGALPTAGTVGRRAFVTDANASTFNTVAASGGTNKVPVYDDGTNWRIG